MKKIIVGIARAAMALVLSSCGMANAASPSYQQGYTPTR